VTFLILAFAILAPTSAAFGQPDEWRWDDRRGVHLRILRDYRVPEGAVSREPIVVIGGSATIDGRAEQDIAVIGGTLRIGPNATIHGDVVTVGAEAIIDPAARIGGNVEHAAVLLPDVMAFGRFFDGWWPFLRLGTTVMRLGLFFVVGVLLVAVAPRWLGDIAHHATASPLTSALFGVAGQILFGPVMVVLAVALAISVIGIPLLLAFPFLAAATVLLWIAGFSAVAMVVGARLRGKAVAASDTAVVDLFVGLLVIAAMTLVANGLAFVSGGFGPFDWTFRVFGWVIEWIAWTVGLGAAISWVFGRRQPVAPPPVPWPSPAPSVP